MLTHKSHQGHKPVTILTTFSEPIINDGVPTFNAIMGRVDSIGV